MFCASIQNFDWFQLVDLWKPDFNSCSDFVLSWIVKVTIETESFVSVIAKAVTLFHSEIAQLAGQDILRLILHLIKGISRAIKKWFKIFNAAAISTFIIQLLLVLSKNLVLNLNDLEWVIEFFGLYLQNWCKLLWRFRRIIIIFNQVIQLHYNVKMFRVICLCYYWLYVGNRYPIFEYWLVIISIYLCFRFGCSDPKNSYVSLSST